MLYGNREKWNTSLANSLTAVLILFLYVYPIQVDGIEINFCIYQSYKHVFLLLMWLGIQLLYLALIVRWLRAIFNDYGYMADKSTKFGMRNP